MSDENYREDNREKNPYAPAYMYDNRSMPVDTGQKERMISDAETSVNASGSAEWHSTESTASNEPYCEPETERISAGETPEPYSCEWYSADSNSSQQDRNTSPHTPPYTRDEFARAKRSENKKHTPIALVLVLAIVLSTLFGGGSAFAVNLFMNMTSKGRGGSGGMTISQVNSDTSGSQSNESGLSTADVVDKVEDSVVEITTEYVKTGVFSQQYITSGGGSGVVVDKNGYIVTNHHVIEDAKTIKITMHSGETLEAKVIGSDSKADVALLKVDAELEPVVFGNSDNLRVGDKTIAIGNPLGQLGGTVTEGIISALDRELSVDGQNMTLLQTDSAINPGNSGGGLFDASGNLIGVVCAKSSGSEIEGLGFAIPINTVIDVMSDLMEYGYVRGRVNLGMELIDIKSTSIAWMYGLNDLGCYVYDVKSGSNAEKSGIRSGDRIVSVNDTEVETSSDIEEIISSFAVGDTVKIKIARSGRVTDLDLTLEEYVPTLSDSGRDNGDFVQWYGYSGQ